MIETQEAPDARDCPEGCGYGELSYEPLVVSRDAEEEIRKQIWAVWPFLLGFGRDGEPVIFVPIWAGYTFADLETRIAEARAAYIPNCCTNFDPISRTCVDRNRPVAGTNQHYKAYKRLDNVTWIPKTTKGRCSP